ncbi:MAG: hypothetical protein VBE63_05385 [Lamprobacter sp.]|uniref:hypothetical protein n=1 Tax=Lamprobacter sp. TaxID=3100796 RepID=UPI002B25FABF|nr:hypothetical protein [Lamprobacter sp.]MEA3639360.1 hypothetical protein [Lamprobacter sp.]
MPAERARQFPNPDLAPRLVLFPIVGGGVALDWLLDPALIQQARIAFTAHQPVAKLCLRRADADRALLAVAVLADLSRHPAGFARFEAPVVGPLQAELGLEGARDGGWLLLARSNRLEAVPEPMPKVAGQSALLATIDSRLSASEPAPDLRALNPHSAPASALAPASVESKAVPLLAQADLAEQVEMASVLDPDHPRLAPSRRELSLVTRFPDVSLAARSERPELRGSDFPLVGVNPPHAGGVSGLAFQKADDLAFVLGPRLGSSLDARLAPRSASDSPSGPVVEAAPKQVLLDQKPPNRQDVVPSETRASRGSGPLSPYPSGQGAVIRGELQVFGSAPPGSLLDLGGHPFRVGSGGRFSFRVALDDPDLLAALLARLPRLPVDERES